MHPLVLLAFMFIPMSAMAQTPEVLQAIVDETRKRHDAPGALAVVCRLGDEPLLIASGTRDVKQTEPVTFNDHFRIGSLGKLLAGTVALRLAETGALDLEAPISRYVDDVPNGESITLLDLGRHTSGLPDAIRNPEFQRAIVVEPSRQWAAREILAFAFSQPATDAPGKAYRYSNSNTILLALAAEAATGKSFANLLKEIVFDPLGMTSSGHGAEPELPEPHPSGYRYGKEGHPIRYGTYFCDVSNFSAAWAGAAGDYHSTVTDMARAVRALCMGELLTPASRAILHDWRRTGQAEHAYGFCIEKWKGGWIGHRGDVPGFQAVAGWHPKLDLGIVVFSNLSNDSNGKGPANMIFAALAAVLASGHN